MNKTITFHIYDFTDGWRSASANGTDHIAPKKLNALIEKHGPVVNHEQVVRKVANVVNVSATAEELAADGWKRVRGTKEVVFTKEINGWPTVAHIVK